MRPDDFARIIQGGLDQIAEGFRSDPSNPMREVIAKGRTPEQTEAICQRIAMRLEGATHEEAMAAFPDPPNRSV